MAIVKQETHFVLGGDPVKGEVRPFVVFANVLIARNDARLIVAYRGAGQKSSPHS